MEQVLKYIGNSAMLTVSPKTLKKKNIDRTTRLVQVDNENEDDIISFRVIRPQRVVFPKVKGGLSLSPDIKALIDDPVTPSEDRLKDPRIQYLLNEDFR